MQNNIHIENITEVDVPNIKIKKMVNWILKSEQQQSPWDITFVFVDDAFISEQNQRFFNKSTPTDVISFNLSDSAKAPEGEIYISVETASVNAAEYGVTLENELLRLVAHGTYHVLDYEDTTDNEKERMTALENKALENINTEEKL